MSSSFLRRLSIIVIFLFSSVIWVGCSDDDPEPEIPYVYVDFIIDPSSILYNNLNIPGNYAYVNGGYRGIIIYHFTEDEYIAYERTCTYDPQETCSKLRVDKSGLIAVDSCCDSKFILLDGSPMEGSKATIALRRYQTSYDPYYKRLHVYN